MDFIFNNFDSIFNGVLIFQGIFTVIFFGIFGFALYSIFSKKGRSRMVGRQLDISKQVLEDNKELIKDLNQLSGEINVQTQREFYENNADDLRYVSRASADIEAEAIRRKAQAFKEGFATDTTNKTSSSMQKYCKYCGASIDYDSLYCNKCGEKQ